MRRNGIDPLLRSLGTDFAQATDVYSVGVLRNLLFAPLVGGEVDEIDLIAIDIQRERDAGLGSLNQARQAIGLQPYNTFSDLTPDPALQKSLQDVYGTIFISIFCSTTANCGGLWPWISNWRNSALSMPGKWSFTCGGWPSTSSSRMRSHRLA
jgi:Animal haem peroxidase